MCSKLDYQVMRHAFDSQNELGRLCDEVIYGRVLQNIPLTRKGIRLGNQRLHMAGSEIAFRLTSIAGAAEHYEKQLRSLLNHTPLRAIQWMNLAHHKIDFVTLLK